MTAIVKRKLNLVQPKKAISVFDGIYSTRLVLIGEDRTFGGNTLFVDLIPHSCWFKNARTNIHRSDWDRVRSHVYERANYTCECCQVDAKSKGIQLEAHERWDYNSENMTQRLVRLIAVCEPCHNATHIGRAGMIGRGREAEEHLSKVTGCNEIEVKKHIGEAFNIWRQRNEISWTLDLSLLSNSGIRIQKSQPRS
jgi:hypothetical protein